MATEYFVVKTRDGSYIGPLGLTRKVEQAVMFESRMAALRQCMDLGAVMERAEIRAYDEEKRLHEPAAPGEEAERSPDV